MAALFVLLAFSSFAVAAYTSDTPMTSDKIFPAISLYMLLQFPLAMVCQPPAKDFLVVADMIPSSAW